MKYDWMNGNRQDITTCTEMGHKTIQKAVRIGIDVGWLFIFGIILSCSKNSTKWSHEYTCVPPFISTCHTYNVHNSHRRRYL